MLNIFNNGRNELDEIAFKEGTDKSRRKHFYTKWYNFYFNSLRHEKINFLEIGVKWGHSLLTWEKFFTNATIYGMDLHFLKNKKRDGMPNNIDKKFKIFIGDSGNKECLRKICDEVTKGFDIIVDDASHRSNHQIIAFNYLFPRLNPGGIYVIEDTFLSYNKCFHSKGFLTLMSFLKKRVDDVNFLGKYKWCNYDIIKEKEKTQEKVRDRRTKKGTTKVKINEYEDMIEAMHFYNGICFIFKRDEEIVNKKK